MRLVLILALLATGCFGTSGELASVGDDNGPPDGKAPGSCFTSSDCVPAAATCCDCPTFATSTSDPKVEACAAVDCDSNVCPTNVLAECNPMHECVLACAQLECLECPEGYITEANGCVSCTCAEPATMAPTCAVDTDCVRVRNDCCGCANGGEDTAVPTSTAAAFDAGLSCSQTPQCPGVGNQMCDATAQARCIRGSCALLAEDMPADSCGRPDLPACPAGTVCRVNVSNSADLYGVGVCRP